MCVSRQVCRCQCHQIGAKTRAKSARSQTGRFAGADGEFSAQVGQLKRRATVASERRAQQRKESRVLRDWQLLTKAKGRAANRKVAGKESNLRERRLVVQSKRARSIGGKYAGHRH